MPDGAAQLRLMAFLSPAFPVGGFSYSHGLERAAHDGLLVDASALREWLADLIGFGSGWNDAVLFAEAHRLASAANLEGKSFGTVALYDSTPTPDPSPQGGGGLGPAQPSLSSSEIDEDLSEAPSPLWGGVRGGGIPRQNLGERNAEAPTPAAGLLDLAHLAEALAGSEERHRESMLQGAAFMAASRAWPHPVLDALPEDCAYSVAAGAILGAHGVPVETALAAWLQAFSMNLVQAAIRLGVTGQQGAMATVASLEPAILATASRAKDSTLDDLGSAALMSEIVAMKHETQISRLFRS